MPFRLCEQGGGRGGGRARDACEKSRELDYCTDAGSGPVRAGTDCAQPIYSMQWTNTRAGGHSRPHSAYRETGSRDTLLGMRICTPVEIRSLAALSNVIDQRRELKWEQVPRSECEFLGGGLKLSPAQ